MPVVVTGAAGFIGGMLTAVLAADGERVVAVDRRPVSVIHPKVTALQADLLDRAPEVESALREADVVYHLAGRPGVRDTAPDVELHRHRDNVLATARVLAAVPLRIPLVVASSSSVYGDSGGRPSAEEAPLRPLGGYARSKVAMEMLCAQRIAAGGTTAVARIFTVAGEGQRADMALATWIDAVRRGEPIRLYGSPWRTRDITDVREVVRSLRAMAERGVVGAINVGTGAPRTLADLVAATCRAVGVPSDVAIAPAPSEEPDSTCADPHRHERLLGFRPITDLDTLVRRQVAALLTYEPAFDTTDTTDNAASDDTPRTRPSQRSAPVRLTANAGARTGVEEAEEIAPRPPTLVETAVVDSEFDEPEIAVAAAPAPVAFLPTADMHAQSPERLVPFRGAASSWIAEHTATNLPRVALPDFYDLPDDPSGTDLLDDHPPVRADVSDDGTAEVVAPAERPSPAVFDDMSGYPADAVSTGPGDEATSGAAGQTTGHADTWGDLGRAGGEASAGDQLEERDGMDQQDGYATGPLGSGRHRGAHGDDDPFGGSGPGAQGSAGPHDPAVGPDTNTRTVP